MASDLLFSFFWRKIDEVFFSANVMENGLNHSHLTRIILVRSGWRLRFTTLSFHARLSRWALWLFKLQDLAFSLFERIRINMWFLRWGFPLVLTDILIHGGMVNTCDTITGGRKIILFAEAWALLFFVHPYVHKRVGQRCIVGCVLIWIQS